MMAYRSINQRAYILHHPRSTFGHMAAHCTSLQLASHPIAGLKESLASPAPSNKRSRDSKEAISQTRSVIWSRPASPYALKIAHLSRRSSSTTVLPTASQNIRRPH